MQRIKPIRIEDTNEFVSGSSAKLLHVRKNQIGDGLSRTLEKHSRLPENGVKRKPVSRAS
jgi:hypothetical protein